MWKVGLAARRRPTAAPILLFFVPILLVCCMNLVRRDATARSAVVRMKRDDDKPCLESPVALAIGIGGEDCASRLSSVIRLRTMLYSLEEAVGGDKIVSNNTRARRPCPSPSSIHLLLWLHSDDNTTLPLVEEIVSNLECVSSVAAIDIGNSTALTDEISPPITEAFIYRRYDWVKFWGIHRPDNPRRFVLNVDVDAVFLRPLSEVWADGCRGLSEGPGDDAFYVAGRESLSDQPGFVRYVNSGVAFLDLLRRETAYNLTALKNEIVPAVHEYEELTVEGTWPPEQWLWNAIFYHRPGYLALFDNATQCNCATHDEFPGAEECKLAHYCNTAATSMFNETDRLPFTSTLARYIRRSLPRLYRRIVSAEKLECPVPS